MTKDATTRQMCSVCGRHYPRRELVPAAIVREPVAQAIRAEHPAWPGTGWICRTDLGRYRNAHVQSLLESERGELTSLEREVMESLSEHEVLASNTEDSFAPVRRAGDRLADRIAAIGGSWGFIGTFSAFIALWVAVNSVGLMTRPLDPFPYILLNLVLSCLAAVQAPVIMMSQNRQEAKDRIRAQHDYQINLKAELEIRHLHEKIDHLLLHQWERLAEIQQIQLEVLSELGRR